MKHLLIFIIALWCLVTKAQELKIMSYNIKLDYPKVGEHSWTNRKPFFIKQLKFYEPDVMGVQEAMPNQMKDMDSLLVDYSYVGVGRDDGKDSGEYSAIFYKTDKFTIVKSGTFWLSETPENVSMGWDAVCNRICTYALLKDTISGKMFWVFNTHFDHVGKVARKNSAELIVQKIKSLNSENYPVVLTGDFNMEPEHLSIEYIKTTLKDAKDIAKLTFGPEGTFNGFQFNKPVTRRIDYAFVSKNIDVIKYAVLSDNWNLHYPSDHLPILITLRL
ncbi:endonuclease/exonuclease/phosphatase family protein [Winogradskyella sediminis]|uniref:Metal-dependent hydrolase, endonuclease/exonuclease/phosphatase family n=1 Tax=Winogradskyella sediminis TaxID=1382466 RepID=A0A1H1Q5K6_9FLAO|nr:endonuclease/exonuclease/phosphatase family protein [Winogradskyella sediminis]SDS18279.1 Metal-dependent hydrolase, endonuclease/exonuclease/phosphatase family [Winogradskyella sediminis]